MGVDPVCEPWEMVDKDFHFGKEGVEYRSGNSLIQTAQRKGEACIIIILPLDN